MRLRYKNVIVPHLTGRAAVSLRQSVHCGSTGISIAAGAYDRTAASFTSGSTEEENRLMQCIQARQTKKQLWHILILLGLIT